MCHHYERDIAHIERLREETTQEDEASVADDDEPEIEPVAPADD